MKKRFVLLILSIVTLVVVTLIITLGILIRGSIFHTTALTMTNALNNDRELFETVVEEVGKYSGLLGVYSDKDDIHYPEHHVVKMGSLYFASAEIIDETSLALLYDAVNPVFRKYDIEYLFGFGEGGRVQFVFEKKLGRAAFLEHYKKEKSSLATRMTVLEEAHICEGWYALVYTD